MLRGEKQVTKLLAEPMRPVSTRGKKGIYLQRRDDALAARFYYYFTLQGLRYDVCLQKLTTEFYLGENTIAQLLVGLEARIRELKEKDTDLRGLRQQYPAYAWV